MKAVRDGQDQKQSNNNKTKESSMSKKMRNMALAVSVVAMLSASASWADEDLGIQSKQAIDEFKRTDSSMGTLFANSAGYAVFPDVGKGGFIVGGARGKGIVFEKGNPVGRATMTQASIGAQAGGQTFAEVIFFETPGALSDFKAGKFEMSADVSAVAASEGASKSAKYKKGVAVFTLSKRGLMVQASVGGQKFKFEPEAMQPTGR
jgi:lipid-binding SYLF domain-containing protein